MTKQSENELKSAYLILGDEPALVNLEIEKIKKWVGKAVLEYNYDSFDVEVTSASQIVAAANTSPFMSDRRLILVRNVERLPKQEQFILVEYLENPSPTTCLILIGEALAEKNELYQTVATTGRVLVKTVEKNKLPTWVKKGFEKRGQVASDAVVKYLIAAAGDDLTMLGNEIEKVSLYCLDERVINLEDAKRVACRTDEARIFDLTDRIGNRDVPGALRVLEQLMRSGFQRRFRAKGSSKSERTGRLPESSSAFRMVSKDEHAMSVLYTLANHFRILLRARALLEEGADGSQIVQKLGIKGPDRTRAFLLNKYRQQSQRFAVDELKKTTGLFAKADLALKSTAQSPEAVLELLVVSLATL